MVSKKPAIKTIRKYNSNLTGDVRGCTMASNLLLRSIAKTIPAVTTDIKINVCVLIATSSSPSHGHSQVPQQSAFRHLAYEL